MLAAAIKAGASVIVTYDLKDFPQDVLQSHGIEAKHPDPFPADQFDLNCDAVRRQRAALRNPPKAATELLDTFTALNLPSIVERLRPFEHLL